jgi:Enterochelin esterase and related enzymes
MLKIPHIHEGKLIVVEESSSILKGNPLNDPVWRKTAVWLPPSYASSSNRRYPVLYSLAGFMSAGMGQLAWRGFDENLVERAARLIYEKKMGDVIIVFPDCFTSLGGNQYINSSALGRYADYLIKEIIPLVDRSFRTLAARNHRGVFGHSSGGYGALFHAMKYPHIWGAAASHAGDMGFETCYLPGWPRTLTILSDYCRPERREGKVRAPKPLSDEERGRDDGRVRRFIAAMRQKNPNFDEGHALMDVAMAATYDPDPDAPNGFRLPFDLETGELLKERWRQWQRHDPIHMATKHVEALHSLRALYFDCGWRDQYHMHYGARRLAQTLTQHGVEHRYEVFNGTHSQTSYRYDVSLPFLYRALKP